MIFFSSAFFFSKSTLYEKFFQENHQGVKQFGSRSCPTICRAGSGSKLFAKVISRRQNSLLSRKEIKIDISDNCNRQEKSRVLKIRNKFGRYVIGGEFRHDVKMISVSRFQFMNDNNHTILLPYV